MTGDLGDAAARFPDTPAVVMGGSGEVVSYRELNEAANRVAHVLRDAGLQVGDHIAILMENNAAYLEAAWAAQRSGLYYTAINSHLRSAEVQYILDDCGAHRPRRLPGDGRRGGRSRSVARRRAPRRSVATTRVRRLRGRSWPSARRHRSPTSAKGGRCSTPRARPASPRGSASCCRPPRSATGAAAPVQIADGLARRGSAPGPVYLSPAPLYHSAPLVYSCRCTGSGRHRRGHGAIRSAPVPRADRAPPGHATPSSCRPCSCGMLRLPEESRRATTCRASHRRPRRRAVPGGGQAADARVVGTDHLRVLRGDRGHRVARDHRRRSGWPIPARWAGRSTPATSSATTVRSCRPGQEGIVYFDGGRPFEYHNDPDKTASIINAQGWRTLGDIGYLDERRATSTSPTASRT